MIAKNSIAAIPNAKRPRTDGNLFIHRWWVFEPNEEESQSQEEDPLGLTRDDRERCKREEHQPVDEDTFPLKKRIHDVSTVQLAHGQQVKSCHKQSGPTGKANRMQQKVVALR